MYSESEILDPLDKILIFNLYVEEIKFGVTILRLKFT